MKYIAVAVIALSLGSCDAILDDDVTDFGEGPSIVRFPTPTLTAPFEVTGEDQTYNARINLVGSEFETMTEDITVTIEVDEANSTAEEGVHFRLPTNTVTLTRDDDYMGSIPVTIITENVNPPTEETLVLTITDYETSSPEEIVISGNRGVQNVTISYICFADLTGTYTMTNSVCDPQVEGITITRNEEGGWDLSTADGGLLQYCTSNTSLVNAGTIIEVCGEILPVDDFAYCASNGIGCITGGSWDAEAGVLSLEHSDTFFGVGSYTSTYTRTSGGPDAGDGGGDTDEGEEEEEGDDTGDE